MFNMPAIIIIDNEDNELLKMRDAFFNAGFPCLPIKYENNDPNNLSGIDHIEIPESLEPRIIVSDLNLKDLQNLDAKILCAPVAQIIKKIIKSGPYMLWIWSRHEKEPAEVVTLLEERYKDQLTLPLHWVNISKNEFLYGDEKKSAGLKGKILELINQNSVFHALWDWEGRIALAAKKTVTALHNLTKPEKDYAIETHNEILRKTLAKIGNETLGFKNASDYPEVAMDLGLAPVLADQLLSISDETNDGLWKKAIPKLGSRVDIDVEIKSKLNSFYHLEKVDSDYPKSCRGVFVTLDMEYVNANLAKFESRLGVKLKTLMYEEFLNCRVGTSEDRDAARRNTTLGFLEVSAECDQAQRKTKLHRYLLVALIPEEYRELTTFSDQEEKIRDKAHDGIYRFPVIWLDNKKYIMKLSFKYQIGTRPNDNKWLGSPRLRIRDQILSDISFHCANYSSRPGIIRFD